MPTVEAHLLDFPPQPLYGEELRLEYRHFLRPEQTFPHLDALRRQLDLDRENAILWARDHCPELIRE
jgi:riboflavin kinase/FMN adenylyltransferase